MKGLKRVLLAAVDYSLTPRVIGERVLELLLNVNAVFEINPPFVAAALWVEEIMAAIVQGLTSRRILIATL